MDIEDFTASATNVSNRSVNQFFRVKIRSKRDKEENAAIEEVNVESFLGWTKKVYMKTWGCKFYFY